MRALGQFFGPFARPGHLQTHSGRVPLRLRRDLLGLRVIRQAPTATHVLSCTVNLRRFAMCSLLYCRCPIPPNELSLGSVPHSLGLRSGVRSRADSLH